MSTLKRVTIMRGLPGSGKSTWIDQEFRAQSSKPCELAVCSADKFFLDEHKKYTFNPLKLGEAHRGCLRNFVDSVTCDWNDDHLPTLEIVVDNTNMRVDEMLPYIRLAQAFDIPIRVVHLIVSTQTAAERNIHNVPNHSIKKMAERFQPIPGYLKEVGLFEEFFHINDSAPVYDVIRGITCDRRPEYSKLEAAHVKES
jgi:tRNA uridine 5-carbamoylmethylation protein Kti12